MIGEATRPAKKQRHLSKASDSSHLSLFYGLLSRHSWDTRQCLGRDSHPGSRAGVFPCRGSPRAGSAVAAPARCRIRWKETPRHKEESDAGVNLWRDTPNIAGLARHRRPWAWRRRFMRAPQQRPNAQTKDLLSLTQVLYVVASQDSSRIKAQAMKLGAQARLRRCPARTLAPQALRICV